MRDLESKNPPDRPLMSAETGNVEISRQDPLERALFPSDDVCVVREDWMVGATGIEPVTPSMSTRCSPAELRALRP